MNNKNILVIFYALILASLGIQGCGGSSDSSGDNEVKEHVFTPPVANAGVNQSVLLGSLVRLDASGSSFDQERGISSLDFQWMASQVPTDSSASLSDTGSLSPTFLADVEGEYTFKLVVNDGVEDSVADEVVITAQSDNFAPVARTKRTVYVHTNSTVRLDGSLSTDVEFGRLSYRWSAVNSESIATDEAEGAIDEEYMPAGDELLVNPRFTAGTPGTYTTELTVNDGTDDSAPDLLTIVVQEKGEATPKADAGADQHIKVGETFVLDATNSNHIDNVFREDLFAQNYKSRIKYLWRVVSKPDGSEIDNYSALPKPSFVADKEGHYQFSLTVSSETNDDSDVDTVTVSALSGNSYPVARAGRDQNVSINSLVQLDASLSTDSDNDALTYTWNITSSPDGSAAALDDVDIMSPSFTADVPGAYVVQLMVNHDVYNSNIDTVVITASETNSIPVAHAGEDREISNNGDEISLDAKMGDSSDSDSDELIYRWSLVSQPLDSDVNLPNGHNYNADPSLIPSPKLYRNGQYVFKLVVRDGESESQPDMLLVHQLDGNEKPVALANTISGKKVFFELPTITLDASNSTDGDGDPLTYRWFLKEKPPESAGEVADPLARETSFTVNSFGRYILRLEVDDGKESSTTQLALDFTRTLTVDAGREQSVVVGNPVSLNATSIGTNITYTWTTAMRPSGSYAAFDFVANSTSQTVTPDKVGYYRFRVTVYDSDLDVSASDTVAVNVEAATDEPTDGPTDGPL